MTAFPKPGPKKRTAREIYAEAMKTPRSKYGNNRALCALNHSHRSKLEGAVCQILQLRQAAGEIQILQVEDHVLISKAAIKYIADFKCLDLKTRDLFWAEAKGFESDRWPIIRKLWSVYGPGKLEVWKGRHERPVLDEVVIPKARP